MKREAWKAYAFWIVFTEAVGALSGLLSREGTAIYDASVLKPPLSPPAAVFPIVWTVLYAMMGIGAARVYLAPDSALRTRGLRLFLLQLAFNFLWSIIFFHFQAFGPAFVWLVILWVLILAMTVAFSEVDRLAALLQIPYLIWVFFAGYLNYAVWQLNR